MEPSKIIIQDRNQDTANTLRLLLTGAGYSVLSIRTRKTLVGLIAKFKPDLLIIEGSIKDKEAKHILAEIKKLIHVKIIATLCDGNRTYLLDKIGFDDCLTKPFVLEDVQQVVRKQLAA